MDDTGCRLDELPIAMEDREMWRSVSWNTESARPDDDESSSAFWGRRFSSVITDGRSVSVKESRDTWCRKYTDDYEVIFVFSNIAEKARDLRHKLFL